MDYIESLIVAIAWILSPVLIGMLLRKVLNMNNVALLLSIVFAFTPPLVYIISSFVCGLLNIKLGLGSVIIGEYIAILVWFFSAVFFTIFIATLIANLFKKSKGKV